MKKWLDRQPGSIGDWLFLIVVGAAAFTALQNLDVLLGGGARLLGILAPFAGALVLAYLLDLLVRPLAARLFHGRRGPAIALAYGIFFLVIVLLVSLVVPQLTASAALFGENLPAYMSNLDTLLKTLQSRFGVDLSAASSLLENSGQLFQKLGNLVAQSLPQLADMASGAAGNVISVFTALAGSIYLLSGKEKLLRNLRRFARAVLPRPAAEGVFTVFGMANNTFSRYIAGQMMDALLVGIETFVLMLVLGLKFAPLIAVLVGATNIIPIFGPFIGAVPSALILLFADPIQALEFLVLILVVQQIDGNFIAPRIVGDAIGISGLWVLVAIITGGDLFGLPGMVVGVPVFAVFYALLSRWVRRRLAGLGQEEPLPAAAPPAAAENISKKT